MGQLAIHHVHNRTTHGFVDLISASVGRPGSALVKGGNDGRRSKVKPQAVKIPVLRKSVDRIHRVIATPLEQSPIELFRRSSIVAEHGKLRLRQLTALPPIVGVGYPAFHEVIQRLRNDQTDASAPQLGKLL